jgi:hypothetical protein
MKSIRRRENDRKTIRAHSKSTDTLRQGANVPVDFVAGRGHVSVPSGDGWAGIEGVTDMEYKMFSGNPGPSVSKRPRKGNN